MKMESTTLSQNMNTLKVDEVDAIGPNEDGPFPDASIVIFDMDTTDGNTPNSEICQIAAWCKDKSFHEYMLPDNDFNPICTQKNGFTLRNKKLFHYGKVVNSVLPKAGLEKFLDFLSKITGNTRNILLAANNCDSFQRYVIVRCLKNYNLLDKFKSLVLGFIDIIPVFKSKLPNRKEKFGLDELAKSYLDTNTIPQQKHAVAYVEILVSLIKALKCDDAMMKQHVNELDEFLLFLDLKDDFKEAKFENEDDATSLAKRRDNWLKKLKKIAEAGITTNMLKDAYRADPDDGVTNLLRGRGGKAGRIQKLGVKEITDKVSELCTNENENVGNGTA